MKIDLASRNKVYYYHLNSYEYYTLSSQGWHKIFAQSTPRMADVLAKLKLTEDLSILQPANYDFPAPSDTQLNLSKEALAASSLASCSYTYDKLNREYQFAITPVDCDEPYVLRIRFYGDNVKLPGADLYTDVNVPPARLKQELYSSNNYRISVFDENGGSVYTADYSNESFKLTDHQTGETVYYDGAFIGFKLMYTLVDGNWVRTEIPISDLYQHILKEIGLDKDYFFDDTRYSSLEFLPEGEVYRCTSLPKGIDAITIRCDGRIYEYEITPTVEAPYRVRIEFSDDIWVTLP